MANGQWPFLESTSQRVNESTSLRVYESTSLRVNEESSKASPTQTQKLMANGQWLMANGCFLLFFRFSFVFQTTTVRSTQRKSLATNTTPNGYLLTC